MTWNVSLLNNLVCPTDVAIILGIPISRMQRADSYGWHFTKSGRDSVKSGYATEREYKIQLRGPPSLGADIKPLQALAWKVRCPPKLKHFLWQVVSGCLPVLGNLNSRGIKCDTQCARCGAEVETINHVLFECPPVVQVWALSKVPSHPANFPGSSIYTNMDYLFSRLPPDSQGEAYPWLLWYIWKGRNDKVFSNIDRMAIDLVRLAEMETISWTEAQVLEDKESVEDISRTTIVMDTVQNPQGRVCQVDGSWKEGDVFSGQGWITEAPHSGTMMGARNIRGSLSPLHAEFEALIWAMDCMCILHFKEVIFATDCSELVKMVSEPMLWPAFAVHFEEFDRSKRAFEFFKIIHIPRLNNTRADALARNARVYPSRVIHVDVDVPTWLVRS